MPEQEAAPAGYSDRLYNEDLAPAKERRWGSYSIFALWMSDVHNLGNYTFAAGLGAVLKCAPPLRSREHLEELWDRVFSGDVEFVTSDHSPCPPDMKAGHDFFRAWGGIMGCQSMLNIVLDEGHHGRGLPLQRIVDLVSGNVAGRFDLHGKGSLEIGVDADLALVDVNARFTLMAEDLHYRHKMSPYVGKTFRGRVVRTVLRGTTIFWDGKIAPRPIGKLIKPRHRKEERWWKGA